jgi:predicted dehydrogenase
VIGSPYGLDVAEVLAELPHVDLRWICEAATQDLGRPKRTDLPRVPWTTRFTGLLKNEELDAVVFAIAPHLRRRTVHEALQADKHVLVFGLLASTHAEAEDLVRLAAQRGRHLAANNARTARSSVVTLRSLLERGALGEVHYLDVLRTGTSSDDSAPNRLWSLGADAVALVLELLGDQPIEQHGTTESYAGVEPETLRATLVFATGITAHLSVSTLDTQSLDRITVVGSRATAVAQLRSGADDLSLFAGASEVVGHWDPSAFPLQAGDVLKPALPTYDPISMGCERFVAGIRSPFEPQTGRGAAAVVGVLELLQRSATQESTAATAPEALNLVQLPLR